MNSGAPAKQTHVAPARNAFSAQSAPNYYPFAHLDADDEREIYCPKNPHPESQELFQFIRQRQQNSRDA